MTYIANISTGDFLRRSVDIFLGEDLGGGRFVIYQDGAKDRQIVEAEAGVMTPSLSIPEASARALLSALLRHFEGGDDMRALRKDYDAERARVDKVTEALIDIAKQPPVFVNG